MTTSDILQAFIAAAKGHQDCVALLLNNNAPLNVKDKVRVKLPYLCEGPGGRRVGWHTYGLYYLAFWPEIKACIGDVKYTYCMYFCGVSTTREIYN